MQVSRGSVGNTLNAEKNWFLKVTSPKQVPELVVYVFVHLDVTSINILNDVLACLV